VMSSNTKLKLEIFSIGMHFFTMLSVNDFCPLISKTRQRIIVKIENVNSMADDCKLSKT
jgi:hypothetical protein